MTLCNDLWSHHHAAHDNINRDKHTGGASRIVYRHFQATHAHE